MRIKAFLVSLLALIVHLATPVALQARSSLPTGVVGIAAPGCAEGGAYVPRASAFEDFCRLSGGNDGSEPWRRRTSSRRSSSTLAAPPARHLMPRRTSYPARRISGHRLTGTDDDRPA